MFHSGGQPLSSSPASQAARRPPETRRPEDQECRLVGAARSVEAQPAKSKMKVGPAELKAS